MQSGHGLSGHGPIPGQAIVRLSRPLRPSLRSGWLEACATGHAPSTPSASRAMGRPYFWGSTSLTWSEGMWRTSPPTTSKYWLSRWPTSGSLGCAGSTPLNTQMPRPLRRGSFGPRGGRLSRTMAMPDLNGCGTSRVSSMTPPRSWIGSPPVGRWLTRLMSRSSRGSPLTTAGDRLSRPTIDLTGLRQGDRDTPDHGERCAEQAVAP
jgi:hypothetical protein